MMRTTLSLALFVMLLGLAVPAGAAVDPAGASPITASVVAWQMLRIALLSALFFATVAAFKIPGTGIAETLAVLLLAAVLVPSAVAGEAQWYEVLAIIAGIGFIAVEIFLIPGLGATGVVGLVLLVGGVFMSFVPDPRGPVALTMIDFRNALLVLIGGTVGGFASFAWLGRYLPHIPRANRLVLRETNAAPAPERAWPLAGDAAVALTDLKPGGTIRIAFDDSVAGTGYRDVNAVSDRGFVAAGERVEVVDVAGTQVTVRAPRVQSSGKVA